MTSPPAELTAYLDHLRHAGVVLRVADDLVHEPDTGGLAAPDRDDPPNRLRHTPEGLPPFIEHRDPKTGLGSDHASWSVGAALVRHRLVEPGSTFWDVGCGTGYLALVAAGLGAGEILASDVDPRALDLARRNGEAAGAPISFLAGSLLDPFPTDRPPDLLATNLPHKPRRVAGELPLANDGGDEGDALFSALAPLAADVLHPGARMVFFLHSLPHPRLLVRMAASFDLTVVSWKRRFLGQGEFGSLADWFRERSAAGTSFVGRGPQGDYLVACVWIAVRRPSRS